MSESMNAIDVAYQTEVSIENKSTEQLIAETNTLYQQAEQLAGMSAAMLAEGGRRILEMKSRIPHGEFGDWCEKNLVFSYRKAARMMQLAEKMDDENSLFSKMPTLANIGISRVWELLAAPEEVAAEVVETNDVADMTVRELKAEIARLKEEKNAAETEKRQIESHEENMRRELASAQRKLAEAVTEEDYSRMQTEYLESQKDLENELRNAQDASAEIQAKLDKAKEDLKKAKAKNKELEAAKDEEVQKRIEEVSTELTNKAKEEAFAESEAELKKNAENIEALEKKVLQLEADKEKLSNTAVMEFKVYCDQLQDIYHKINGIIDEQEDELAQKMYGALDKLLEAWRS